MLPGLQTFDVLSLTQCETLDRIRADLENNAFRPFSHYSSSTCSDECNEHHLVAYLESILHLGLPVVHCNILELISHRNSKVRKMSLLLHYRKFAHIQPPACLQEDPSHIVREIYLTQNTSLDTSTLIRQARDENTGVRLAALRRLMGFSQDPGLRTAVLKCICRAMSDRMLLVREYASRVLGEFGSLPDSVVERLFRKQIATNSSRDLCGALVYGIEDEYPEVRRNTALSAYALTTPSTVSKIFEFLVDCLNDDDERLREICTECLSNLSKKYVLSVDQEIVAQICGTFEENNAFIKSNLLRLLSRIRYEHLDIFDILVSHMATNIEPRAGFECIRKIVSRNGALFFADIRKFYEHTRIALVEPRLDNSHYVAKLVVLSELRRLGFEFEVSGGIEEHFLFLRVMRCRAATSDSRAAFLRDILLQFLRENGAAQQYRRIFADGGRGESDPCRFLCFLYRGVAEWRQKGRSTTLQRIPHVFANTAFSMSNPSETSIAKYIQELNLDAVRALQLQLDIPSVVRAAPGMPIRFSIRLHCEISLSSIAVRIRSRNGILHLAAAEKMDVCLLDFVPAVQCSLVKIADGREVRVSSAKTVMIEWSKK